MKKYIAFIGRSGSGKDYVTSKVINALNDGLYGPVERFAFADAVKQHIAIILNLDGWQFQKFLQDEDFKNHSLVSLSQMKIVAESDTEHIHPDWDKAWTASKFDEYVQTSSLRYDDIDDLDVYMSLRDFIVFYGTNVIQKCLGRKVWCNRIFNSDKFISLGSDKNKGIAIITDVRFPHEFRECEDNDFVFIKVEEKTSGEKTKKLDNIAESYMDMFHYDYLFENDKDNADNFNANFDKLIAWIKEES